jgi:dTDP-glucose 4,6-dehydratase
MAWDVSCWTVAVPAASWLRFDGSPTPTLILKSIGLGLALGILQVLILSLLQRLRGRHVIGSFDEISAVTFAAAMTVLVSTVGTFFFSPPPIPRSVPFIAGALALVLMLAGRFALRLIRQRNRTQVSAERVIIYGAGDTGEQIVRQMIADPNSGYVPIAILDDNPRKKNLRIHGIRVVGSIDELDSLTRRTASTVMVVAIASISSTELLRLDRICSSLGIALRTIPTTSEIVGGAVKLGDISHVSEEDLLGRRPIVTDEPGIHKLLRGRRILITGAGGSIGSELVRQVVRYEPKFVGILDRDESAMHAVQLTLDGRGLLCGDDLILADIRDDQRLQEVFSTVRPEIVFHAAALKHLSLLERYPEEAHKTNVLGTENVLKAAKSSGVQVFVNISTDKAADPSSILGKSKLVTEQLTAGAVLTSDHDRETRYMSVRFGNVLGSRGSVLTAFRYQIEKGGPVTVTDPDVTRYFMTIPEAVHLVLQAAVIGSHGETLILDMGEPVKILEVAEQMIAKSGRRIDIVFTGLRPGEKLDEVLLSSQEVGTTEKHPLVFHTKVTPMELGSANRAWMSS